MHDIKSIRDDPAAFDQGLASRGLEPLSPVLLRLDDARRTAIAEAQSVQERRNVVSREIGRALGRKDANLADRLKAEVASLKQTAAKLETAERDAVAALDEALVQIPNIPASDVPVGADERGNVELRRHGATPVFGFAPREHFDIGEALGLMDFDAAARMSGARFVVLRGALARLHRALGQFMLNLHTGRHGYQEIDPPLLVRDEAMVGTAQLPKFRDDQFRAGDAFWLIPTAEVPLTNLVRQSIVDEARLPQRYTALTACFRAEAGSAGRDTRGMIRQHQFAKVELVSITTPEQSTDEHERMTACAEAVLKELGLPYRVMLLCTGDMGFGSRKTYDLEVWLPGQGLYREISSCSVCGDFQARRMDARYRAAGAKQTRYVYTLNGSGVAVGRAMVAILENYQNADGSVTVPDVLRPLMDGLDLIEPVRTES